MSYQSNYTTAEEVVNSSIQDDRVFIHSVAAAPGPLINAMTARAPELEGVEIIHLQRLLQNPMPFANGVKQSPDQSL